MHRTWDLQVSQDPRDRRWGNRVAMYQQVVPWTGTHESGAVRDPVREGQARSRRPRPAQAAQDKAPAAR